MKILKESERTEGQKIWEEESGFIAFLGSINSEVNKFNEAFEFGVHNLTGTPRDIDGDDRLPLKVGFILERNNPLLPDLTYCLYSLLKGRALFGYIGTYRDGRLTTLRELKPIMDFKTGGASLYDWMRQLVRASCEKIML